VRVEEGFGKKKKIIGIIFAFPLEEAQRLKFVKSMQSTECRLQLGMAGREGAIRVDGGHCGGGKII